MQLKRRAQQDSNLQPAAKPRNAGQQSKGGVCCGPPQPRGSVVEAAGGKSQRTIGEGAMTQL
jgi:hypothetical protein